MQSSKGRVSPAISTFSLVLCLQGNPQPGFWDRSGCQPHAVKMVTNAPGAHPGAGKGPEPWKQVQPLIILFALTPSSWIKSFLCIMQVRNNGHKRWLSTIAKPCCTSISDVGCCLRSFSWGQTPSCCCHRDICLLVQTAMAWATLCTKLKASKLGSSFRVAGLCHEAIVRKISYFQLQTCWLMSLWSFVSWASDICLSCLTAPF